MFSFYKPDYRVLYAEMPPEPQLISANSRAHKFQMRMYDEIPNYSLCKFNDRYIIIPNHKALQPQFAPSPTIANGPYAFVILSPSLFEKDLHIKLSYTQNSSSLEPKKGEKLTVCARGEILFKQDEIKEINCFYRYNSVSDPKMQIEKLLERQIKQAIEDAGLTANKINVTFMVVAPTSDYRANATAGKATTTGSLATRGSGGGA